MLVMADPASKVSQVFPDMKQAEIAIGTYGFIPLLSDGTAATVNEFEGAHLVQGAPINAWVGGYWYTGQKEIVSSLVQAGQVPQPPPEIWNLPVVDPPADVLANYAAAKGVPQAQSLIEAYTTGQPISAGGVSWETLGLIGAAVVGLVFLLPKKGKKSTLPASSEGV